MRAPLALVALVAALLPATACTPLLYEGKGDLTLEPVEMRLVRITPSGLVPAGPIELREDEGGVAFLNDTQDAVVAVVLPGHALPVLRCSYTNGFESDGRDTFTSAPLAPGGLASLCVHTSGALAFEVRGLAKGPLRGTLAVKAAGAKKP